MCAGVITCSAWSWSELGGPCLVVIRKPVHQCCVRFYTTAYLVSHSVAFQEVFNLFDINGGGTIDADELDAALKTVDIHLTHKEIQDVLQVIDEDGKPQLSLCCYNGASSLHSRFHI